VKKSSRQTTVKTPNYRPFQINIRVAHAFIKGSPYKITGKVVVITKQIEPYRAFTSLK